MLQVTLTPQNLAQNLYIRSGQQVCVLRTDLSCQASQILSRLENHYQMAKLSLAVSLDCRVLRTAPVWDSSSQRRAEFPQDREGQACTWS
jgi:hypothetical protein